MKDNDDIWNDITLDKVGEILSKEASFVLSLTNQEALDYVEYCLLMEKRDEDALKLETTEEMLQIVTEDVPERLKAICRKQFAFYLQMYRHQTNQNI